MKIIPTLCAVTLVFVLTELPASISGQTKDSPAPVFPWQTEGEFEAGNIANRELWGAHLQELLRSLPH